MVSQSQRPAVPVHDPYAPASARQNARKKAGTSSAIERLMQDSANGLDVTSQLRYLKEDVLADGIEADESGMVRAPPLSHQLSLRTSRLTLFPS